VEAGDLVFFAGSDGTVTSPGHVGLVIGNGQMIEAFATGTPIRTTSIRTDGVPVGFTRPWANPAVNPATVTGSAAAQPPG
jgi:cell wall-associated NlpC family hydrolase